MFVVKEMSGGFSWLVPAAWLAAPKGGTRRVVLAEAPVCTAAAAPAAITAAEDTETMSLRMGILLGRSCCHQKDSSREVASSSVNPAILRSLP